MLISVKIKHREPCWKQYRQTGRQLTDKMFLYRRRSGRQNSLPDTHSGLGEGMGFPSGRGRLGFRSKSQTSAGVVTPADTWITRSGGRSFFVGKAVLHAWSPPSCLKTGEMLSKETGRASGEKGLVQRGLGSQGSKTRALSLSSVLPTGAGGKSGAYRSMGQLCGLALIP